MRLADERLAEQGLLSLELELGVLNLGHDLSE